MTKSTITRERLQEIAEDGFLKHGESKELARMALAAMDSEPVGKPFMYGIADPDGNAYIDEFCVSEDLGLVEDTVNELNYDREEGDELNYSVVALYRHAQSAQISEPVLPLQDKDLQGVIDALEHPTGINAAGKQVVRHALVEIQERRKADREPVAEVVSIYGDPEAFGEREIRPLVGIQQMPYGTKLYRHAQPVPVVSADLLHTAASAIEDLLTNKDRTGAGVWFDLPFRLRSAANEQTAPVVDADDNFYSWFGREWAENYQHNQYTTAAKQMLGVMAESAWKAGRRAAMLAAAPQEIKS